MPQEAIMVQQQHDMIMSVSAELLQAVTNLKLASRTLNRKSLAKCQIWSQQAERAK